MTRSAAYGILWYTTPRTTHSLGPSHDTGDDSAGLPTNLKSHDSKRRGMLIGNGNARRPSCASFAGHANERLNDFVFDVLLPMINVVILFLSMCSSSFFLKPNKSVYLQESGFLLFFYFFLPIIWLATTNLQHRTLATTVSASIILTGVRVNVYVDIFVRVVNVWTVDPWKHYYNQLHASGGHCNVSCTYWRQTVRLGPMSTVSLEL